MNIETDHIYTTDCLTLLRSLDDHSIDCIIADPPYFRVKGDFDFKYQERDEFLAAAEEWAKEMARVLAHNGSLVWFCSDRLAAHLQVMLERHFTFLNLCTIVKCNSIQNIFQSPDLQRTFCHNEERFLFMSAKGDDVVSDTPQLLARNAWKWHEGIQHTRCVRPVIDYLRSERDRAGFTNKQIGEALGLLCMPLHWFTTGSQFTFPTRAHYEAMQRLFNRGGGDYLRKEYDDLRKEYDDMRKEYDDMRRPFNTHGERVSDVFTLSTDSGASARLGHPTVKPLGLIRKLVRIITREGQTVLDPFLGSGTTAVAAKAERRHYIGCDTEQKYIDIAQRRLKNTIPSLL